MHTGKVLLMLLLILSVVVGCEEGNRKQPSQEKTIASRDLSFQEVAENDIPESKPKGWSVVKTIELGTAGGKPLSFLFFSRDTNNTEAEVEALFQYDGKLYDYQPGILPYRLSEVEVHKVDGSFNQKIVLAGIGTALTAWDIVVLDNNSGKLSTLRTIGRPEMIDLDSDGHKELVASFYGVHLQFPNVEIFRYKEGKLESALVLDTPKSDDPEYARLVGSVIEIGKVREEKAMKRFVYENGRLVSYEPG